MFLKSLRHSCALILGFLTTAFVVLLPTPAYAASPLDTLDREHPRLFLHDRDLPALKRAIDADPFVKQQFDDLKAYADQLLTMPPNVYVIGGVEHTLLDVSRSTEGRVFALAGAYRITGDRRYADRAIQEMLAAAAFPDWYPMHFLDTGEMTATLGLGYDWLYPVISPADRAIIRNAIATKGIDPWLERIRNNTAQNHEHNNWNQVCNGGESIGALAIADEDPERAEAILSHAHQGVVHCRVSVRVIFLDNLTHHARALDVALVRSVPFLVHRVQDAPVYWLQAVTHVRQRPPDDYAHGVIKIRAAHLVFDVAFDYTLWW